MAFYFLFEKCFFGTNNMNGRHWSCHRAIFFVKSIFCFCFLCIVWCVVQESSHTFDINLFYRHRYIYEFFFLFVWLLYVRWILWTYFYPHAWCETTPESTKQKKMVLCMRYFCYRSPSSSWKVRKSHSQCLADDRSNNTLALQQNHEETIINRKSQ